MADTPARDKTLPESPALLDHPLGAPVASPAPPLDGKKPIAKGAEEVEKFLVTTDTGGGD